MSARRAGLGFALGAFALGATFSGGAQAAVISFAPAQLLSAIPFNFSFGGATATYGFTAAATGNGPGAAVQTGGSAQVSTFFGDVTDFGAGATIDQNGQIYSFSAFPTAALIPNSPADDFIGLAFTLSDGLHFGYAEVAGASLVRYGYQSTPGASIVTGAVAPVPEPAAVLMFVTAVAAIAGARRVRRG